MSKKKEKEATLGELLDSLNTEEEIDLDSTDYLLDSLVKHEWGSRTKKPVAKEEFERLSATLKDLISEHRWDDAEETIGKIYYYEKTEKGGEFARRERAVRWLHSAVNVM